MSEFLDAVPNLRHIEDLVDQTSRTMALYEQGLTPGDSVGLKGLGELYTVAVDQWTAITGFPGSGKSEFLDHILVYLARHHGWHFAFYSPENQPSQIHVAKLAEKYLGKPFAKGQTARMSRAELDDAIDWIQKRFVWLTPNEPDHLSLLASAMAHLRGPKRAIVLDPWNTLEHKRPKNLSETEYIGVALGDISQWVRRHHIHVFVVAHPQKMYRDAATGKRPVPTPYDIAGSAHWFNKGDNILCVDRDQASGSEDVQVYVQKVRYKHIGRIGLAHLKYDRVTGIYRASDAVPASFVVEEIVKGF